MNTNTDRFVRRQNVSKYQRLLDSAGNETEREKITKLLAEEKQKQKAAEDPEFRY